MVERRVRRRRQIPDNLQGKERYRTLKEDATDGTLWRTRFGKGYGTVVRETTE